MLTKLIVNNTIADGTIYTLIFSDGRGIVETDDYSLYGAEKRNIYENGEKLKLNDRMTVYTAPASGCSKYENTSHCIEIAETLDAIAAGEMYVCHECHQLINSFEYYEETEDTPEHYFTKCDCITDEEPEPATMYDYFDEDGVYNIEYRVNGPGADSINSVEIMIAYGGPNIYIDTADRKVKLYWWSENAEAEISRRAADEIDEYFNEIWVCTR